MTTYTADDVVSRVEKTIPDIAAALSGGYIYDYVDIVAEDISASLNTDVVTSGFEAKFLPAMYWGTLSLSYMYQMGVEPTDDITQITIDVITISKEEDRNKQQFKYAQSQYTNKLDILKRRVDTGGSNLAIGNTRRRREL